MGKNKERVVPNHPNMMPVHHVSHGDGSHARGHEVPGNIARDGAAKKLSAVRIHSGMQTQAKGAIAYGAGHRSALDALTGGVTVPGSVQSEPGWGSGGVRTGLPLATAPGSKRLTPPKVSWSDGKDQGHGMRSRTDSRDMHALGEQILREAFSLSEAATARAHGRDHVTGAKLPDRPEEN